MSSYTNHLFLITYLYQKNLPLVNWLHPYSFVAYLSHNKHELQTRRQTYNKLRERKMSSIAVVFYLITSNYFSHKELFSSHVIFVVCFFFSIQIENEAMKASEILSWLNITLVTPESVNIHFPYLTLQGCKDGRKNICSLEFYGGKH